MLFINTSCSAGIEPTFREISFIPVHKDIRVILNGKAVSNHIFHCEYSEWLLIGKLTQSGGGDWLGHLHYILGCVYVCIHVC